VLLQLPFDLAVSVLLATNIPFESCLTELPPILHSIALCAYFPSVKLSRSIKIIGEGSERVCLEAATEQVTFTPKHQYVFAQLIRAVSMFDSLQELVVDMRRTSLGCGFCSTLNVFPVACGTSCCMRVWPPRAYTA
jgi:hypothetical protein